MVYLYNNTSSRHIVYLIWDICFSDATDFPSDQYYLSNHHKRERNEPGLLPPYCKPPSVPRPPQFIWCFCTDQEKALPLCRCGPRTEPTAGPVWVAVQLSRSHPSISSQQHTFRIPVHGGLHHLFINYCTNFLSGLPSFLILTPYVLFST